VDWVMQVSNTVTICFLQTVLIALFASDQLMQEGKLMEYNREITHLASVDPLTGLMNRRSAQDEVARMVSRSREEIPFVTVVMGDIDFFKTVNDTYGHEMGDTVLKTLANCFKEELKDVGVIARWGGEEFLFIFPGLNGDQVFDFMEKLRRKIKHIKFQNGDTEFKVSMTFGVQEHDFRDTIDETIDSADRKLYRGKASGRDVVIY
jgi:diguanylate cyclase (GGDEF)-like protein